MDSNTGVAIVAIAVVSFACVLVYNEAKTNQTAMQNGLQECVIKFDGGVTKAWMKECPK